MSLMDNLGKGLASQFGGGQSQNQLLGAFANLLASRDIGGLGGLAQLFHRRGHGDAMASWISRGENKPISPDALQDVLGQERLQEVASSAGVSPQEASQGLSSLLPQLIDKLTPDGQLPDSSGEGNALSQIAGRFLGRH